MLVPDIYLQQYLNIHTVFQATHSTVRDTVIFLNNYLIIHPHIMSFILFQNICRTFTHFKTLTVISNHAFSDSAEYKYSATFYTDYSAEFDNSANFHLFGKNTKNSKNTEYPVKYLTSCYRISRAKDYLFIIPNIWYFCRILGTLACILAYNTLS